MPVLLTDFRVNVTFFPHTIVFTCENGHFVIIKGTITWEYAYWGENKQPTF